jgi:hypothetical protein
MMPGFFTDMRGRQARYPDIDNNNEYLMLMRYHAQKRVREERGLYL